MAYTKTKWVNNSKPAINQDNLNHAVHYGGNINS